MIFCEEILFNEGGISFFLLELKMSCSQDIQSFILLVNPSTPESRLSWVLMYMVGTILDCKSQNTNM